MINLPACLTVATFDAWRDERNNWEELARNIAQSAGFSGTDIVAFGESTNLVIALDGSAIIKIFPPFYHDQFVSERAALQHLDGKLTITTPHIINSGEQDGWSWIVMSKLQGVVGSAVWSQLSSDEMSVILHDVGRVIAEVHSVSPDELTQIGSSWPEFIRDQSRHCVERHRQQGLSERFMPDLSEIAKEAINMIPMGKPYVVLTGDWIPQNFLLSDRTGQWRLSALIDFGDVRTGWHEYDFVAPSALMCEGNPRLVKSLFDGYGIDLSSGFADMRRRLLTLMVLHQESDFRHMVLPDWDDRISNLFELEGLIWPKCHDDPTGR